MIRKAFIKLHSDHDNNCDLPNHSSFTHWQGAALSLDFLLTDPHLGKSRHRKLQPKPITSTRQTCRANSPIWDHKLHRRACHVLSLASRIPSLATPSTPRVSDVRIFTQRCSSSRFTRSKQRGEDSDKRLWSSCFRVVPHVLTPVGPHHANPLGDDVRVSFWSSLVRTPFKLVAPFLIAGKQDLYCTLICEGKTYFINNLPMLAHSSPSRSRVFEASSVCTSSTWTLSHIYWCS